MELPDTQTAVPLRQLDFRLSSDFPLFLIDLIRSSYFSFRTLLSKQKLFYVAPPRCLVMLCEGSAAGSPLGPNEVPMRSQ